MWTYTLISVFIVSATSFVGVLFLLKRNVIEKILFILVSLAIGSLLGDSFFHLLPESYERLSENASFYIIGGILFFFALEKFIRWRHCHIPAGEAHIHPLGTLNLIGDSFHNFTDGFLIAGSFAVSIPLGITTTIAIILHEIPQEIGDFGILVYSGYSIKKALFFNFISSLSAFFGAILALSIKIDPHLIIPFTAGGFIYIAGSDLIPELQHSFKIKTSIIQFLSIIIGLLIMCLLKILE